MLKKNLYALGMALFIIITLLLFNITLIFEDDGFVTGQLEQQKASEKVENAFEIDRNIRDYITTINELNTTQLSEREILHLEDVKSLYNAGQIVAALFFFLIFLGFFYRLAPPVWQQGVWLFCVMFLLLALSALARNYFDFMFTLFHKVFFTNDLWILYPHHVMINIYPQEFFLNSFLLAIKRTFFMGLTISVLLTATFFFRFKKKEKQKTEEKTSSSSSLSQSIKLSSPLLSPLSSLSSSPSTERAREKAREKAKEKIKSKKQKTNQTDKNNKNKTNKKKTTKSKKQHNEKEFF